MGPLWGIDLGGTKIEGVVMEDRESRKVLRRMRLPTEQKKGYVHILRQIYKLVEVLTAEAGMKPFKIGICTPGTLDPLSQTLKNSNTTCLNNSALKKDLENFLGLPIEIANDANCFTLAETHFGIVDEAMPEAKVVFGVIMGTGVGGGIAIDGKVIKGRQGIAGEWGHIFLDESGGDCYCGKKGCVETVISGTALQNHYSNLTGYELPLEKIVERHLAGEDEIASNTVERLLHFFGKGMSTIINILDPDVVVLGGGLGNIELLYSEGVEEVEKHVFNDRLETVFLKPKLGDSAGVFGAALMSEK